MVLSTQGGNALLESMAASHRTLWIWHCIEETEHKAVAYDVYTAVKGRYTVRVIAHVITTIVFYVTLFGIYFAFTNDCGKLWDVVGHIKFFYHLYVFPGVFRGAVPLWFDYMKPGFHPWHRDNSSSMKIWAEKVLNDKMAIPRADPIPK